MRIVIALIAVAVVGVFLVIALQKPSNTRAWKDYLATPAAPLISPGDTEVTFQNVRDYTYDANGVVTKEFVTRTYAVEDLSGMRVVLEPFPQFPVFGHTFLVFEFENADPIAFSIESRLEEGETYSIYAGLINSYELAYTWGTERDFLTRRAVMLGNELYSYELHLPQDAMENSFIAFARATAELEATPRFYNTLLHNCTNELANIVNDVLPGALPWDVSRVFTGTADKYLFKLGIIDGESFSAAKEAANITERVRVHAMESDLSRRIRK